MKEKKIVLILDDDFKYKTLLEKQLKNATDHEIILASDGDQAWEFVESREGKIDLIITDIIHSGLGGIEFPRTIKEKYPAIKIVICTGLPLLHDDFKKYSEQIIYKPFKFEDLLLATNSVMQD